MSGTPDGCALPCFSGERPELEGGHKPREWRLVVYPCGVEWDIKTFEPYKAPGIDRVYPLFITGGTGTPYKYLQDKACSPSLESY